MNGLLFKIRLQLLKSSKILIIFLHNSALYIYIYWRN